MILNYSSKSKHKATNGRKFPNTLEEAIGMAVKLGENYVITIKHLGYEYKWIGYKFEVVK